MVNRVLTTRLVQWLKSILRPNKQTNRPRHKKTRNKPWQIYTASKLAGLPPSVGGQRRSIGSRVLSDSLGFNTQERRRLWTKENCASPCGMLETFIQGKFQTYNHICICDPVHELLEYARTFWSEPLLGCGTGRFCGSSSTLRCGDPKSFCNLLYCKFELHFLKRILWANWNMATLIPEKLQGFCGTLLNHCCTLWDAKKSRPVMVRALATWAIYTQWQLQSWSSLITSGVVTGYKQPRWIRLHSS